VSYSIVDIGIVSCSRVALCGATFHQICLASHNYNSIHVQDGCIKCKATNQIQVVQGLHCDDNEQFRHQSNVTRRVLDSSNKNAAIVVLDSDDDND